MSTNDLEPARQQTLNRIPIGRMGTATELEVGSAECQGQSFAGATMSGRFREGFRMPAEHERSSEHKG